MGITWENTIVWLIVGALAGSFTGMIVTWNRKGFGRLKNLGLGMIGALLGTLLFRALHIDLGLGWLKITGEDLVAAFAGSLLFLFAVWLIGFFRGKSAAGAGETKPKE